MEDRQAPRGDAATVPESAEGRATQEYGARAPENVGSRVRAGQPIGERYIAIRPLGEGGMGSVWEVEHRELGRRFALKLLRDPAVTTEAGLARFHREARSAGAIDHPEVMRDGERIPLPAALEWLVPVASALDALHERGLVHRDVKPENVVRVLGRAVPTVKLVDFGLAAHVDGRDRITRQGMLVGTPHYMAPEVAEGEVASARSDVYSLAVLAYELLTGKPPHDGESPMELFSAKLTIAAPSLSERTGRLFAVPLELAFHTFEVGDEELAQQSLGDPDAVAPASALLVGGQQGRARVVRRVCGGRGVRRAGGFRRCCRRRGICCRRSR